jgi:hypothetical protein
MNSTGSRVAPDGNQHPDRKAPFLVNNLQYMTWFFLAVSCVGLSIGYLDQDFWYTLPGFLLIMLIGIFSYSRSWILGSSIALLTIISTAAMGFYLDINPVWLILGLLFGLFFWDMSYLNHWMQNAGRIIGQDTLLSKHVIRLMAVGGIGFFTSLAALSAEISLRFGWLVFLGLVVFIALSFVISSLLRMSQ